MKGPVFNQTPEASSSSARARPSMVEWKERAITTNTVLVSWLSKLFGKSGDDTLVDVFTPVASIARIARANVA